MIRSLAVKMMNIIKGIQIAFVHMKIRTKFLFVFFFIMVVSVSSIMVAVTKLSESVFTKYSVDLTSEFADQIAINIDARINDIEEMAYEISQNNNIKNLLYQSREGIELYEKKLIEQRITALLNSAIMNAPYVNKIAVVTENGEYFWWHNVSGDTKSMEYEMKLHFDLYIKGNIPLDHSSAWFESPIYGDEIFLVRPIVDENNITEELGYIWLTFKNSALTEVAADEEKLIDINNISVVGQDETLFFGNELISRRFYLRLVDTGNYMINGVNTLFVTLDGQRYLLVEKMLNNKDWKIMIMVPQTAFDSGISYIQLIIYVLGFGAMILTVIIAFPISGSITKNIALLDKNMEKLESGDFSIRIKPVSYDEIGLVSLRFNYMAAQIQNLVNQLYLTESEKRKVEQEVLKAQINPHFLYNTLGSIKWLAESKGQEDISELVTSLVELLKVSVKQTGVFITLKEELAYIRNYMSIQLSSLDAKIQVKYMIEPGVEDLYVLNFMLQPIVENAIFHGFSFRAGENILTLRAYRKDTDLIVKVIDNGKGMTRDKIFEIMNYDKKKHYSGLSSIGVKNVNERMKLHFGSKYELLYESVQGEGTTVTFRVPLMTSPKEV